MHPWQLYCFNLLVGIALNVWFTTNVMCVKNDTHIYVARTSNDHGMWLLLAATVWNFAHLPLGLSDCNKMVLWPGCEGCARCNLHKKNVWSVRFVVKRWGCCCNLSVGVVLNAQFTGNRMCAKNNTHIYVAWTANNRVIMACDLYCCWLPQCEALCTGCSGFPITTVWNNS